MLATLTPTVAVQSLRAQVTRPAPTGTVVRHTAGTLVPALWTADTPATPLGRGREDGSFLFADVIGLAFLDDDRLLVADGQSSELRVFSLREQRHLSTIAKKGQGPGEIEDLWSLWRTPNGIVAEDAAGKASLFHSDGRFVRVMPRVNAGAAQRADRIGMVNDTLAVVRLVDRVPEMKVGEERVISMGLALASGATPQTVVRYPERQVVRRTEGRPRANVFGATTIAAVAKDRLCVGHPDRYIIDCYSVVGRHLHRIERTAMPSVRVTEQRRADYFAGEAAANPGPRGAAYVAQLRSAVRFAATVPMFGEFIGASNGDLWVGPYIPAGPLPAKRTFLERSTTWSVFSPTGQWKADVQLPARFQLLAIDGNRLAGVARTVEDVEQVVILQLKAPR
ncbi:MAG TPA: hypothetical protein VGE27_01355 [Gemmatimonas sp.]|uniref:hypothetical protein n=1 Tax=Gemmatimonas sp. TaxID=1962908 RepID=UPI002ED98C89